MALGTALNMTFSKHLFDVEIYTHMKYLILRELLYALNLHVP
jgi:hypothetical protein